LEQGDSGDAFCLICGDHGGTDAVLNVLLFVPLGVGLAIARKRAAHAILAMSGATILIEALQVFAIPGRDGSVGDVITNSLGGIIGFVLGSRMREWIHPSRRLATWLGLSWMMLWIVGQAVASFALRPVTSDPPYFGQIARPLDDEARFPGVVLSTKVAGELVPDFTLSPLQAQRIHATLDGELPRDVEVVVVPRSLTSRFAPILRLVDQEAKAVVWLAAQESDIAFGARTGAAALRLRSVRFRLPDVFPPNSGEQRRGLDTIRINARHATREVSMSVMGRRRSREARIDVTPSLGWRLFSPVPTYADGSMGQVALNGAWLFASLAPAGYWAAFAGGHGRRNWRTWAVATALVVATIVGLAVAPAAFGLAFPSWSEFLSAGTGLIVGAKLAHVVGAKLRS
jgi:hypothetical protein